MLSTGLVYLLLGTLLHILLVTDNKQNKSLMRIRLHFIMLGSFNMLVFIASFLLPFIEAYQLTFSAISILVFMSFVLLELNKSYRKYRDSME